MKATIGSYFLRTEKEKRDFFRKQANTTKGIPLYYPWKICKSLPEYLISQDALGLSSNYNPEHVTSHAKGKSLTEHLILSVRPVFLLSRTPQIPS